MRKKLKQVTEESARTALPPQGIPAGKLSEEEIRANLTRLFQDAKQRDARSFMTAVLLYTQLRGPGDEYQMEMQRTLKDFNVLLDQLKAKRALYMFIKVSPCVYSHILETRTLYVYLYNLLQICRGLEIEQYPFQGTSIENKVNRIKKIAEATDHHVGEMPAE